MAALPGRCSPLLAVVVSSLSRVLVQRRGAVTFFSLQMPRAKRGQLELSTLFTPMTEPESCVLNPHPNIATAIWLGILWTVLKTVI